VSSLEEAKSFLKHWRAIFALTLLERPKAIEYLDLVITDKKPLEQIVSEAVILDDRLLLSGILGRISKRRSGVLH
jgi:hypothetical protein